MKKVNAMKMERTFLLAAFLLGTVGPALAGNPAQPGKGPPDCPGTPGAFISASVQALRDAGIPPGQVVKQIAQGPQGPGVGKSVKTALTNSCGIGALAEPQEPNN